MREIQYREAIREAIIEEMDRDRKVFLIGEDVGVYGGAFKAYKGLLDKYGPDRVINTPISETAIRDNSPVMFIEHKMIYPVKGAVPEEEYTIPFGKADIKRKGEDITIFAYSNMVLKSIEAAEELEREGISCEVVDPRTLVPLDIDEVINSVKKTGRLIIVSEACRRGSVASDISARVTERVFEYLKTPVKIVAGLDTPIPYNSTLERASIPQEADIIKAAGELLE